MASHKFLIGVATCGLQEVDQHCLDGARRIVPVSKLDVTNVLDRSCNSHQIWACEYAEKCSEANCGSVEKFYSFRDAVLHAPASH